MKSENEISLKKCTIRLLEPGIIENYVHPGELVDLDLVAEMRAANMKLAGGKKYVVFASSGHLSTISKEAMTLLASKDYHDLIAGKALLLTNFGHKLVGNFYLQVKKPAMPTKIFENREEAMVWLRELLANK